MEEGEKVRITKQASLFEFKSESSIRNFWNSQFSKENLIKEDHSINQLSEAEQIKSLSEQRSLRYGKVYKSTFNK